MSKGAGAGIRMMCSRDSESSPRLSLQLPHNSGHITGYYFVFFSLRKELQKESETQILKIENMPVMPVPGDPEEVRIPEPQRNQNPDKILTPVCWKLHLFKAAVQESVLWKS